MNDMRIANVIHSVMSIVDNTLMNRLVTSEVNNVTLTFDLET